MFKKDIKKIISIFFVTILFIIFTGCSVSQQVVGEFYLNKKDFDKGSEYFKANIKEEPNSALAQYYYGRFLLANKKNKEAFKHLQKATKLDNSNADFHCWLGVAYASLKQLDNEKKEYLLALQIDKKHLQSLTYLAHSLYDSKQHKEALKYYTKVIKIVPYSQAALFNRAMVLKKLLRKPEEKMAWKEYLDYYPAGSLARDAVKNLNMLGNFDYLNHIIGLRTITLNKISFEPFSSKVDYKSEQLLSFVGNILKSNEKIKIHIVVYQQENSILAQEKAKSIKKYIVKKYPKIDSTRLMLSWFKKPKIIKVSKKKYIIGEYIEFITAVDSI